MALAIPGVPCLYLACPGFFLGSSLPPCQQKGLHFVACLLKPGQRVSCSWCGFSLGPLYRPCSTLVPPPFWTQRQLHKNHPSCLVLPSSAPSTSCLVPCQVLVTSGWMQQSHHGRCNQWLDGSHQGLPWYLWRGTATQWRVTSGFSKASRLHLFFLLTMSKLREC